MIGDLWFRWRLKRSRIREQKRIERTNVLINRTINEGVLDSIRLSKRDGTLILIDKKLHYARLYTDNLEENEIATYLIEDGGYIPVLSPRSVKTRKASVGVRAYSGFSEDGEEVSLRYVDPKYQELFFDCLDIAVKYDGNYRHLVDYGLSRGAMMYNLKTLEKESGTLVVGFNDGGEPIFVPYHEVQEYYITRYAQSYDDYRQSTN